ncbi:MAG TPA: carboxypeptidase-like regulatory domain-containing protein [Terriglobales bacterium]|nr:carboxypeptidase-like regulatory domain-containing protein [Terriglobales bacterium]
MKLIGSILAFLCLATCARAKQAASASGGQFEVSGTLVNWASGEVVHNAFVQLRASREADQPRRSEVGTDGSFIFHNVTPGKYNLGAQAPGFLFQSFDQHEGFSTAIVVGPEKVSTGIVFRMRPMSAITGRVLDEHNEPVRDAQVWLFQKRNDMGRSTTERRGLSATDDLGEYRFGHLGPGTYYLVVSAQPWYRRYFQGGYRRSGFNQHATEIDPALDVAYPLVYYPGTMDADEAGAIVLRAGDRISADFSLTPVQSLHLTIRQGSGEGNQPPAQPSFRQIAFGQPVGFQQANIVYEQGEMEISGIAPGNYDFNLHHFDPTGPTNQRQSLNVQQSGDIDVSAGANLEGVHGVVKFDDTPPQNAFLQFRDLGSGNSMGARVNERGEFNVQPEVSGRYVAMLANAPGYAIRSLSATGARVSGRTIEITGAQPIELSIVASKGVGTINGIVMNGDKPLPGAMVVLVPEDISDNASLFRRDQSDSDGTFMLPDVVPGRYTIIAIRNGWDLEWGSPDVLRPYLAHGTPVQIGGKQTLDIKVAAR